MTNIAFQSRHLTVSSAIQMQIFSMTTTNDNLINTIENMDTDVENGFSSSMLTFAAVMTFAIMIVGIIGNFLTVVALIKCPKVRNVAAAFIISLCLADLIFCIIVLPFSAIRFLQGTWTHGDVLCKLIPFIQYGNIGVSLLCIAMITINRYVMIAHHSCYGKIYKKHWIAVMIAFCWLFSYGMQLPTLLGVWGAFGFDPKLATCSIMSDEHGHSSKTTLFITAFVIPCIIIIACYAKIFWVVHKSEQRLKKHANKQNSIPNNLRPTPFSSTDVNRVSSSLHSDSSYSTDIKVDTIQKGSQVKDHREIRTKRNEWRITKMVLAIFLSFVICYLPITIAKVADKNVEYPTFHILSYIMLYLSACINPIIYVIMNKQYRKAYKTVITCEPSKLLPFGKPGTGNSAAEKWKDTGLTNNHSRTLMSQMSTTEQQNTSLSSSQTQPTGMEMTTKINLKSPQEISNISTEFAKVERPSSQKETIINCAKTTHLKFSPLEEIKETNRITLVEGDIILEEEEEDLAAPELYQGETMEINHPEIIYVNAQAQKRNQFYGQNINATQDNTKLMEKIKINEKTN